MLKFPSINKTDAGGVWRPGPDATVDPRHVIAVEPREHRYSLDHAGQLYAVVHLSTGAVIEVMSGALTVQTTIREAMADAVNIRAGITGPADRTRREV